MGNVSKYTISLLVSFGITQFTPLYAQTGPTPRSHAKAAQKLTAEGVPAAELEVDATADPGAPIELVNERYPDGALRVRREVTLDTMGNYIFHGDWTMYTPSGEEIAHGRFENNRRQGEWTRIYERADAPLFSGEMYAEFEAPFTSVASFKDGKLHGVWTIYDGKQRVVSEWEYAHGKRHGIRRWNYPSGELRHEITYKDGLIDGKHQGWDKNGQLTIDHNYQSGRRLAVRIEHFKNAQKKSEGMYLHEKLVLERPENWWTADTGKYVPVGSIERHGRYTCWHENGHKMCEQMFDHENPVGEYSWWHSNSQLGVSGQYDAGERQGTWVWWHPNGQKSTLGHYVDGEIKGQWSYWTAKGTLEHRIDYSGESRPVELHADSDEMLDDQDVAGRQAETDRW